MYKRNPGINTFSPVPTTSGGYIVHSSRKVHPHFKSLISSKIQILIAINAQRIYVIGYTT